MDILATLDNVLMNIPATQLMVPPLRRKVIVDAADEIRMLRGRLATATGSGKTRTVPEIVELMAAALDGLSLEELADGDAYHAILQGLQDPPATRVIDWNGLPDEHASYIIPLLNGTAKWSELATSARRSITIHALTQLAHFGRLTIAEYSDNKPLFMPSASALAQIFGIRWSELVANAVNHASSEVTP